MGDPVVGGPGADEDPVDVTYPRGVADHALADAQQPGSLLDGDQHLTDEHGRINRTVHVDPDRAHLITWAFYRYAEGDCSLNVLLQELTARGLTTRPTPKWPSKSLSVSTLHKVLHNPYYKGQITYGGTIYPGVHEPLVDPRTWQQVQDYLAANNLAGTRQRTKPHYLRGSVYCTCGSRLLVERATNRWGTTYEYFVCSGRSGRQPPASASQCPST